jgi:hypothetical protein
VRRRSWGAKLLMPACRAHRFTAYQTTLAVTPASCRSPPFKTRLNTFPSLTPECRSQALRSSMLRTEINQLKRVLLDKTMELDFFKGALQKVEARRQKSGISGEKPSTTKSKK